MREGLSELKKFASYCRSNGKEAGLYFDNHLIDIEGEPVTLVHGDFKNGLKAFKGVKETMNWLKRKYPALYKSFKEKED